MKRKRRRIRKRTRMMARGLRSNWRSKRWRRRRSKRRITWRRTKVGDEGKEEE